MSELGLPGTGKYEPQKAGADNSLGAGIHLIKIDNVKTAMKTETAPRKDSRGYPGVVVTLKSLLGRTEENKPILGYIDSIFYYDPAGVDAPHRQDPKKLCKSEFNLKNLKNALGFGEEPVSMEVLKQAECWAMVHEVHPVYKDSREPVLKEDGSQVVVTKLTMKFWPKDTRPAKAGDPLNRTHNPEGIASGDFVKIEQWPRRQKQQQPTPAQDADANQDYEPKDDAEFGKGTVAPDQAEAGDSW